jgi:hypothetical protein
MQLSAICVTRTVFQIGTFKKYIAHTLAHSKTENKIMIDENRQWVVVVDTSLLNFFLFFTKHKKMEKEKVPLLC